MKLLYNDWNFKSGKLANLELGTPSLSDNKPRWRKYGGKVYGIAATLIPLSFKRLQHDVIVPYPMFLDVVADKSIVFLLRSV